ncbi:TetR/AcrR family transcriptional regulator [Agreia sp. VKM Ac-1783]|uniref:TetR/AcrR family transcriptional regulator n=1 Tax=Agreia sp. VKM Ac-1783 TaxID=1938889 RepID=UPI000A2AACE4|nr:TetR/AcrR family transcriptional regulator [Agreia sp. VKM Ac-1783]SMQ73679.1 transcriptional regulator, TetR family [Agreia sp. VKM Ac-1783]
MTATRGEGASLRGPYAKGIRRRQEILDKTLDVVVNRGVHQTSLRAIAETIGVSHSVLTHYFGSREALLVEVIRQHDNDVEEHIGSQPSVIDGMMAGAALNIQVPGLVALFTSLMAMSVEQDSEDATKYFRERYELARRDLVEALRGEMSARHSLTDVDLENVSALILAAFDGLQVQWLLDPSVDIGASLNLIKRIIH